MATASSQSGGGGPIVQLAFIGLLIAAMIIIPIAAFGLFRGNGAVQSTPIDPSPNSPAHQYIQDLKRLTNTRDYLATAGPEVFDSVSLALDKLEKELNSTYADNSKHDDAITLLTQLRTELNNIRTNTLTNPTLAKENAIKFTTDRDAFELLMADIVTPGKGNGSVNGSTDCSQLADEPDKVKVDHPNDLAGLKTGSIVRKDGTLVPIDPLICQFLNTIVSNGIYPITLSSIVGTHSQNVAGSSGRQSRHWTGHGVDIWEPKGGASLAGKLMPWIYNNQATLRAGGIMPSQVIGPKNSQADHQNYTRYAINGHISAPGFYVSGHNDHVHIGF